MTKYAVARLIPLALLLGCASPGLLLVDRGDAWLVAGDERVPLSPEDALVIYWSAADGAHSTADLRREGRGPGLVRLVEANGQFWHLRSDDWDDPGDLNQGLLRGQLRLVPRSGRFSDPTVLIPVELITSVEVHPLLPRYRRPRWSDAWRGMAAGFTGAMAGVATGYDPFFPDHDDAEGVLVGTLLVSGIGGVVYPTYCLFTPRYADEPIEFRVGPGAPYQLEVVPRR